MIILGIESSCDETAASIITDNNKILSNVVLSQIDIHNIYGGVVPEIASRRHMETITYVVETALKEASISLDKIDGIAVTYGPGLIGSLLVGLSFAKSLSYSLNIPYIGVNHLEGHLMAIFLERGDIKFPFIGLVVSGGHTNLYIVKEFGNYILLGKTLDDAAGEAFDKISKFLNLGYPGGVIIDKISKKGNPEAILFPRPYLSNDSLDFSFSGLKTAVINFVKEKKEEHNNIIPENIINDICASFQEAVVDVLIKKTIQASQKYNVPQIVISGGVAANSRLREKGEKIAKDFDLLFATPSIKFCTDNASMIALVGAYYLKLGKSSPLNLTAFSRL